MIRIAEGSNGVIHTITVYTKGTNNAVDLTGYTTASLIVTDKSFSTVYATISLTIVTPASGLLRYTTSSSHTLPSVSAGQRELELKAQLKISGSGLFDLGYIEDFVIENDISS